MAWRLVRHVDAFGQGHWYWEDEGWHHRIETVDGDGTRRHYRDGKLLWAVFSRALSADEIQAEAKPE